jgi:hypothetical protein
MRASEWQRSFGETVVNDEVSMAEAGGSHLDEDFIRLWSWCWDVVEQLVIFVVLRYDTNKTYLKIHTLIWILPRQVLTLSSS